MMKVAKTILLAVFMGLCSVAQAESALTTLPIGIIVGKTSCREIAAKGNCVGRSKIDAAVCAIYKIPESFEFNCSEAGVMTRTFLYGGVEPGCRGTGKNSD